MRGGIQTRKPTVITWQKFTKGLNTLVNGAKIRDDELQVANNVILVDEGAPTRRWGTENFGNSFGSGGIYGMFSFSSSSAKELIVLKDGLLRKYNSSTGNYDSLGGSFTSGVYASGVLAYDSLYIANGTDPLTKYNGTTVTQFTSVNAPSFASASRGLSLASGPTSYVYRVTAVTDIGETTSIATGTLSTLEPRDVWNTDPTILKPDRSVVITWTTVTNATGYNIYGIIAGDERFIDHVDGQATVTYRDYGYKTISSTFPVPTENSTTGPKGKFIIEYKSALLIGGNTTNPSRLYYSAGLDKVDSFNIGDGGGFIDISKNADDGDITGAAKFQNKAIIFKERSVWQFEFTTDPIPTLYNINTGLGCIAHNTIKPVENDLFFVGRKVGGGPAIYTLGNEPNFLNILRTNEISTRVRPTLSSMTNYTKANAQYYDGKYVVFYSNGTTDYNNKAVIYDRERLGFYTWTSVYPNLSMVWYDSSLTERFLYADGYDGRVTRFDSNLTTDKGTPITWQFRLKDLTLETHFDYKKFKWIDMRLRNVKGTSTMNIYSDATTLMHSTSVSGETANTALRNLRLRGGRLRMTLSGGSVDPDQVLIRRVPLRNKGSSGVARSISPEFTGSATDSMLTLLDTRIEIAPRSKRLFPREELLNI